MSRHAGTLGQTVPRAWAVGLEGIDHLSHPSYPLDVQAGLIGDDGSAALVWMRLTGVVESGHLVAELLNNPFAKHGCAPDDLMALGVAEDDEGTLRLFAHDAMADESWDQRAWVSALSQC